MATVERGQVRQQASHFGLYRTSVGGDESIVIRRKIADPTDYLHSKSRKLLKQRANLALASQHYARLTPSQKAITRHQIEIVEYQKSHAKTDTKLLSGRQLFIAKEMHSLETTGKQLLLPHERCITLVGENLNPLSGDLSLFYFNDAKWWSLPKDELSPGNWLFYMIPPGQEAYRLEGSAPGYYDRHLPQDQSMSEADLLSRRYHVLYPSTAMRGWSFVSRYWWNVYGLVARINFNNLYVWARLKTYDSTGLITIFLYRHGYPYIPENLIASQTSPLIPNGDEYQNYYAYFVNVSISEGDTYWIGPGKTEGDNDLWYGIMRVLEIE